VIAGIKYAILAGAKNGILLNYGTSGEITGDNSSVVGYGAVALVKL
jgi:AmmeMemoRadiSam system protein B